MTKKVFTKDELAAKALAEVGDKDKLPATFFATDDGHFFLVAARHLAIDHARRNGLELHSLKRDEITDQQENTAEPPGAEPEQVIPGNIESGTETETGAEPAQANIPTPKASKSKP